MSGLCGCIHWTNRPRHAQAAAQMADAAAYRGPDGIEAWSGARASLTHLALNVTAADERESQPIVENGLILVADARIDDRSTLQSNVRRQLRTASPTDADLILAAYRRWGTDCPAHLIGDFAFALWDPEERRLFAARDPMGMRPLHYRIENDRLLFGSDVKQLLAAPEVPARISEPMVAAYLQNRLEPLDWTFYEDIFQLKPAHALLARPGGSPETWRYWDVDPDKRIRYDDERDYVEHFREVFAKAVRARLRSAQPVGLFLSGGVDSGSIASMAGHLKETEGIGCPTLQTYSWAFKTLTQCDEREVSTQITDRYNLPSTPIDAESVRLIGPPHGVPDRDSPFMSHYQALLAEGLRRAREHGVRCMLSGQNGDLMVGSWIFDNITLLRKGRLKTLREELQAQHETLGLSFKDLIWRTLYRPIRAHIWPEDMLPRLREPLWRLWRTVRPAQSSAPPPPWMSENLRDAVGLSPDRKEIPSGLRQFARRRRYETIHSPLQRRIGAWSERLFAHHHMTYADPWADRRLIEYVMAVPQHQIFQRGQNKSIARRAMRGITPDAARNNLQKVSLKPLYEHALKDESPEQVHKYILQNNQYLNSEPLTAYYKGRLRDQKEESFRFWLALCLNMWVQQYNL